MLHESNVSVGQSSLLVSVSVVVCLFSLALLLRWRGGKVLLMLLLVGWLVA